MLPSSNDLAYFVEISSALNLSRAAERLGVSQPSLTLSMQRLEASIGAPLLIRGRKGITLTQPGKQLLLHAKDLLQRWQDVRTHALASMHEVQGSYSIGCHPSVALYSLPQVLGGLLEEFPKLELRLTHDLSRRIVERVIRMDVDVGVVVNPVRHPDLVIRKLCDDEVTLWVGKGRRTVQDCRSGSGVLICDPELLQTQDLMKRLGKGGLRFGRILTSASLEVIASATSSGSGVGILPGRVAAFYQIRRVERAPTYRDEVCVVYRVENRQVRALQAVVQAVERAFNSGRGGTSG